MAGCDISRREIEDNKELSLGVLQHVAGDKFFEIFHTEIGLSRDENKEVAEFLYKSAPHFINELKEEFHFIKK